MSILSLPIPPKPEAFTPYGVPPGVVANFSALRGNDGRDWYLSRATIAPRVGIVHTNAARGEGNLQSQINWGNNADASTKPHYCVNWPQPTKLVPTNRQAIANSTEDLFQQMTGERDCAFWTLAIETADTGTDNDPGVSDFLTVSKYGSIPIPHAEIVARILAYESIVWDFPIEVPSTWNGRGVVTHTWPYQFPHYTIKQGKTCPGPKKIETFRNVIIKRAAHIRAAWLGATVQYFVIDRLGTAFNPIPVWFTSDGVVAFRVPSYMDLDISRIAIKAKTDCDSMVFVNSSEFIPSVA